MNILRPKAIAKKATPTTAEYAAWKVERHSGVKLELSDWQRRHPLLAAPGVYLRLRRQGLLR